MDDSDGDNRPYYAHIIGMSTASIIHALALVSIPSPVLQGLDPSLGVPLCLCTEGGRERAVLEYSIPYGLPVLIVKRTARRGTDIKLLYILLVRQTAQQLLGCLTGRLIAASPG